MADDEQKPPEDSGRVPASPRDEQAAASGPGSAKPPAPPAAAVKPPAPAAKAAPAAAAAKPAAAHPPAAPAPPSGPTEPPPPPGVTVPGFIETLQTAVPGSVAHVSYYLGDFTIVVA